MNLACLFLGHGVPEYDENLLIGEEHECWRCGELMVLTCWWEEPVDSGVDNYAGWLISWRPRRYVEAGKEDQR